MSDIKRTPPPIPYVDTAIFTDDLKKEEPREPKSPFSFILGDNKKQESPTQQLYTKAMSASNSDVSIDTGSKIENKSPAKRFLHSLKPSRSIDAVYIAEGEEHEKKVIHDKAVELSMKSKRQYHHQSIEILQSKQITTKNKALFDGDVNNSNSSKKTSGSSPLAGGKSTSNAQGSLNLSPISSFQDLSEQTGYKSSRSASNRPNIETGMGNSPDKTMSLSPEKITSPTSTMNGLRAAKMSAMFLMSQKNSSRELIQEEEVKSPKSFKSWYLSMLQEHDSSIPNKKKKIPNIFSLSTIFGTNRDSLNLFDRILWIADCYTKIVKKPEWTKPVEEKPVPTAVLGPISKTECIVPKVELDCDDIPEAGFRMVFSGKPTELLQSLIFPLEQDMTFTQVFLATYRSFLTPFDVLNSLSSTYLVGTGQDFSKEPEKVILQKQIRKKTLSVLLTWINNHWIDFHTYTLLFNQLTLFSDDILKISFGHYQKLVHAIREQRLIWYTYQYIPMFTINRIDQTETCTEWDIESFAHNLTMIDHLVFRKTKPDIYFQLLHTPATIESGISNVPLKILLDYCLWFRTIVGYVVHMVSKEVVTKKRTLLIRMFIKISKLCIALGNFFGAFAISYGLKSPACLIWINAWESLPTKYLDQYMNILEFMNPKTGFQKYHDVIQTANPPMIPFLPIHIQELIHVHDNTPISFDLESIEPRKINFKKNYLMVSIVAELETYRLAPYSNELEGDRESNSQLLAHIKQDSTLDDISLGTWVHFGNGEIPDENPFLNSPNCIKAIKKIVSLITNQKE